MRMKTNSLRTPRNSRISRHLSTKVRISSAIEAYQRDEEENRGIMAYLGDRKRFSDKVYSIFPSVEKVGDRLMGVFTCQICGELDSYEYDELLHELSGQASDGWGEGFEQRDIHTSEGDIYVSFYDTCGAWELMTEKLAERAMKKLLERGDENVRN